MVSNPFTQIDYIARLLSAQSELLAMINRKLDHIIGHQHEQLEDLTLDHAQLDRLVANTKANTDATKSAAAALTAFVQSNAELTTKLKEALDKLDNDEGDTDAVRAAADALEANNSLLMSNIPKVAEAVTDNTPASS